MPALHCPNGDRLVVLKVHNNSLRAYCLFAGSTPGTPQPLLIYLHDEGRSVATIYRDTTLRSLAEAYQLAPGIKGFALAVPQGRLLRSPRTGECNADWDFFHRNFSTGRACPSCPMGRMSTNEDVALLDHIVNDAVSSGEADPTRVYLGGWGTGGFFAQMYGTARSRDLLSAQPSGACVAAVSVVSSADPFNNITANDAPEGCMLKPYPKQTVPTMVSSYSCDAVCCDGRQPHCPLAGAPGFDTARWVADAKAKMAGLEIRWDVFDGNGSTPATSCDHSPACDAAVAAQNRRRFPIHREAAMLAFLGGHEADPGCWDRRTPAPL